MQSSPERHRGHITTACGTYGFAKSRVRVFFHISSLRTPLKKLSKAFEGKQIEFSLIERAKHGLPRAVDIVIIDLSAAPGEVGI